MPEPVTFRPRGGQIIAWVAIAICALGLVYIAVTDGVPSLIVWAWPIVLVAWLAWVLYIHPYVRITEGFIEIGNVFRTHRVPWSDVADVESRYALTIRTASGRSIRAWAAPAPRTRAHSAEPSVRLHRAAASRGRRPGSTRSELPDPGGSRHREEAADVRGELPAAVAALAEREPRRADLPALLAPPHRRRAHLGG